MKRFKLLVLPASLFLLLIGWVWYDSLQHKRQLAAQFELPADKSPRVILEFLRKMDGSMEISQGVVRSDNTQLISMAVLRACEYVPDETPHLTEAEQREVCFYRLKYTGGAILRGFQSATQARIDQLLSDTKMLIASASGFGSQEQEATQMALRVLEGLERNRELLAFEAWLSEELLSKPNTTEKQVIINRLERLSRRFALLHRQLKLESATLASEPFDIQSLGGKIVLIEFWGVRCQPCLADFPALKRIYQKYHDRGFEIVGICLNAEPERVRRFAAEHDLPWIQLCDDHSASRECNQSLSDRFGIEAVPTTFLLDPDGLVLMQGVRPLHGDPEKDLERQLEKLFLGL